MSEQYNAAAWMIDRHVDDGLAAMHHSEAERAALSHRGHAEHLGIVEAVLAGDVALARHRMLRHLEFVAAGFEEVARLARDGSN